MYYPDFSINTGETNWAKGVSTLHSSLVWLTISYQQSVGRWGLSYQDHIFQQLHLSLELTPLSRQHTLLLPQVLVWILVSSFLFLCGRDNTSSLLFDHLNNSQSLCHPCIPLYDLYQESKWRQPLSSEPRTGVVSWLSPLSPVRWISTINILYEKHINPFSVESDYLQPLTKSFVHDNRMFNDALDHSAPSDIK